MNKLVPIEFKEQRILTTKQLAEVYMCSETHIQQNFNNNIKHFEEGKHYYLLKGESLREFKRNIDLIEVAPNVNKLYLWTERGANRHCKILDTDRAWEQFDNLEETYFKVKENVQAQIPKMSKELQAIFMLDEKTVEIDNRLTNLEERMTIETGAQNTLRDLVNSKVVAILGGKDSPAYSELSKKAFSQCWKEFKNILNVASYKDTPVKDFDLAKKVIIDWKPNRELELMIRGCNAQIKF